MTTLSEMGRLFDSFFAELNAGTFATSGGLETATPLPRVDVSETADAVHVTAELPGVKDEDIEVTLSGGSLVIQGEKRGEKEEKEKNYYRVERTYGTFQRSIALPADVDDQKVDASLKSGVLNVVTPKVAPSRAAAKKIPVRRLY